MADITGDQRIQSEVLEGLATAVNHRRWFVELALPYLGDNPIEIGSGLGDYALEWAEHLPRFTATEADPDRLVLLKERMADHPNIDVRQMLLPSPDANGEYSAAVSYNVLEHIEDHVGALRSMADAGPPGRPDHPDRAGVHVRDEPGRHRDRPHPPVHQEDDAGGHGPRPACRSRSCTTRTRSA